MHIGLIKKTTLILFLLSFYHNTYTAIDAQQGENLNRLNIRMADGIDDLDIDVAEGFEGTFTCLDALKQAVDDGFEGTFTVLAEKNIKLDNLSIDIDVGFDGTFTCLDALKQAVDDGFHGTFTILAEKNIKLDNLSIDIDAGFDGTFTILAEKNIKLDNLSIDIDVGFDGTFTCLDALKQAVDDGFDGTFTVLVEKNVKLDNLSIDISLLQNDIDDIRDTQTQCCTCDFFITQADIPLIIRDSGVYCLVESVSLSSDIAITISAVNDVVLDMRDHVIDGLGGANCINVIEDCFNIVIKNGTVKNSFIDGISVINSNCIKVEKIKTVFSSSSGISILLTSTVQVKNCQSFENLGHGFLIASCDNVVVENCISSSNSDNGLRLDDLDGCVIRNCVIRGNLLVGVLMAESSINSTLINVESRLNGFSGFEIKGLTSNNIFISCIAQDNTFKGFEIEGDDCIMRECIANNNDGDGFEIAGENHIMRECIANNNGGDGFDFSSTTTHCKLISSCAMNNTGVGIKDGALLVGSTGNRFFNNTSLNNAGGDYSPVLTLPVGMVVTTTALEATTGFWVNISN